MVGLPRFWVLNPDHTVRTSTSIEEWAAMFDPERGGDKGGRAVGKDQIGDVFVSTVFLGVDHNWGDGPPILFETMVFRGLLDERQWRYATWDEAAAGHARVVQAVRDGTDPDEP
jgi:hypothetical protein